MKVLILSDLHLDIWNIDPSKPSEVDLVVLAGDIKPKLGGVRWAIETFRAAPVLYVFGNHEFYGEKWPRLIEKARTLAHGTNVHILENDSFELNGWHFFGATLWSDFRATGNVEEASLDAQARMNDFKRIRHFPSFRKLAPINVREAHAKSLLALRSFLEEGEPRRSIVITHHVPSLKSVPVWFANDPLTGAYASDLEPLISELAPRAWIHGHIHSPVDYWIGETQVLANPRGYPDERVRFDSNLTLTLG